MAASDSIMDSNNNSIIDDSPIENAIYLLNVCSDHSTSSESDQSQPTESANILDSAEKVIRHQYFQDASRALVGFFHQFRHGNVSFEFENDLSPIAVEEFYSESIGSDVIKFVISRLHYSARSLHWYEFPKLTYAITRKLDAFKLLFAADSTAPTSGPLPRPQSAGYPYYLDRLHPRLMAIYLYVVAHALKALATYPEFVDHHSSCSALQEAADAILIMSTESTDQSLARAVPIYYTAQAIINLAYNVSAQRDHYWWGWQGEVLHHASHALFVMTINADSTNSNCPVRSARIDANAKARARHGSQGRFTRDNTSRYELMQSHAIWFAEDTEGSSAFVERRHLRSVRQLQAYAIANQVMEEAGNEDRRWRSPFQRDDDSERTRSANYRN